MVNALAFAVEPFVSVETEPSGLRSWHFSKYKKWFTIEKKRRIIFPVYA